MTDFLMFARTDCDTANLKERLDVQETEQVLREMMSYDNKDAAFGKSLRKSSVNMRSFRNRPVCDAGNSTLCVSSSGDCYPCSGFIGYKVGNARERSIADIWKRSTRLRKLRRITWADFPECLQCKAFRFCSMCFGRNFNENRGNMLRPTAYQCDIARLNMRIVKEVWRRPQEAADQKESGGGFSHIGAIGPQGRQTYQKLSAVFGPSTYPATNCGISILGAGALSNLHKLLEDR